MDKSLDMLFDRRSVRRYTDEPVSRDLIDALLTAATWAPSAHNRQPWRFAVITTAELKHRLATAMGDQLRRDLSADSVPISVIDADVQRSYQRITRAPALILVCLSMEDMDQYGDDRRDRNEQIMAIQSTALAAQNLLLAAHAHGLGACWLCAPLFCPDVVVQTLDLPTNWQPQALITVGFSAESRTKTRHPLASRVRYLDDRHTP